MNAPQTFRRPAALRQADTSGSSGGQPGPTTVKPAQSGQPPRQEMSKEISEALVSVVEAAQHLCQLLETENAALKEHRFADIEPLQERKGALTRLYEQGMKQLAKAGPEAMRGLAPALREQVLALATRLDELVGVNGRLLKASIEANQRVLKAVVDATRKHQAGGTIYDREGVVTYGRRKGTLNAAISVNRTL